MTDHYQFVLKMYWIKDTKRRKKKIHSDYTKTGAAM